jgi:hypothetical protein
VDNSTGGAAPVGTLVWAARSFNESEFLKVATQAADFFYDQRDFVSLGLTDRRLRRHSGRSNDWCELNGILPPH